MVSNKILNKTIIINAQTSKVWNALINPEQLKKYMFGCDVITDWEIGSPILFKGNWNGTDFIDKGTLLDFQSEKTYQYNYWSNFSGLPDTPENYSIIKFEIERQNENTLLKLTQSNFATPTMYEHSDKNWEETLGKLKDMIENNGNE